MSTRQLPGPLAAIGPRAIIVALGMVALPLLFGPYIAARVGIFAIFAMGYNLLLGYSGELSFGHSALIGAGGYTMVFGLHEYTPNMYILLIAAAIAGGLMGLLFAVISLRRRGIYFAMITLALSQMVFFGSIYFKGITGGRDGMALPVEFQSSLGPLVPLQNDWHLYALVLLLLLVVTIFIHRVIHSPFGRSLMAIRENEDRAVHLGYKPNRFLTIAFVMSGAIAGLAGGLYSILFSYLTSEILNWVIAGDVVLMTLLGGMGTLGGPVVGALLFVILQDILINLTNNWQLPFGVLVILIVLFAPGGTAEVYDRIFSGDDEEYTSLYEYLTGKDEDSESKSLRERLGL